MLELTAVRLIRWYHFEDRTIPIRGSTLLLGNNGAGKSTVLDAMQLCLTGDQSMVRLNKAANDTGKRTAYAYVRHEVKLQYGEGEDGERRTEYRRGACTGYIALQFDEVEAGASRVHAPEGRRFTAGLVLDAPESNRTVSVGHFILRDTGVGGIPVKKSENVRTDIRTLDEARTAVRLMDRRAWLPDAQTYRRELRQLLGVYSDKFHRQLVHTLAYQPVADVRKFVTDYLAEPRPVQTDALLDNLEHLRRFEKEAKRVRDEISALDTLCEQGERVQRERRTVQGTQFIALRAKLLEQESGIAEIETRISELQIERRDAAIAEGNARERMTFLGRSIDRVQELLAANATHRQIAELERREAEVEAALAEAQDANQQLGEIIALAHAAAGAFISPALSELRERMRNRATDALFFLPGGESRLTRASSALAESGEPAGGRAATALSTLVQEMQRAKGDCQTLRLRLSDEARALRSEGERLYSEERELQQGRLRYSDAVEGLRQLLGARLRSQREPRPLCELIDVRSDRWRDAVEAVLGRHRFSIIVDPADFDQAIKIYKAHRSGIKLEGGRWVSLFGAGLVNLDGVRRDLQRRDVHPDSLALHVQTDDELARMYVDFLLGDMICCEHEGELKKHRRAIEPGGMRYQQHEALHLDIDHLQRFIGATARLRRQDEIGQRLAQIGPTLQQLHDDITTLSALSDAADRAASAAATYELLAGQARRASDLQEESTALRRQLSSIDRSGISDLIDERDRLRRDRASAEQTWQSEGAKREGAERLLKEQLEPQRSQAYRLLELATVEYEAVFGTDPPATAWPVLERNFERALARHRSEPEGGGHRAAGSAAADRFAAGIVRENHEREFKGGLTTLAKAIAELVRQKQQYADRFETGLAGATDEDYAPYAAQRELLVETQMPRFEAKIAAERARAMEHLANDVVQQLATNFRALQAELALLNKALRDTPFSGEVYEFRSRVDDRMLTYYNTIMEAQRIDAAGGGVWDAQPSDEARAIQTGLEALLTGLVKAEQEKVKTDLERMVDYRVYFSYDIRIHKPSGGWQSYTEVYGTGSGGQTQTPYYVAVLSAMRALYSARTKTGTPEFGLVLLDEAFRALDGPRIAAVLHFARELGLQLVLATPGEKVPLVGPHIDTSILIAWDDETTRPEVLDFTKEFRETDKSISMANADASSRGNGSEATVSGA